MALTQSIDCFATPSLDKLPVQHSNIIPFPSARALLQVTLPRPPHDPVGTQLRALLHSPLGVYVISTEAMRDEVRVQLDIACEDFDFTLHTLIATVPAALIGPMKRRGNAAKAR
ncbi:hypothetical protein CIC12_06415 [Burkholderia sp. SG-MS1]|nr:hypothetical protein [Paraburkholderia sp. SG-MS1]